MGKAVEWDWGLMALGGVQSDRKRGLEAMCSILTSSEVQYTCGWANESQCDGIGLATDLRFEI